MPDLRRKPQKRPRRRGGSGRCTSCCLPISKHSMPADLLTYAAAIGLEIGQFAADLEGHRYASVVRDHFLSGLRSGVNGTPAFFVNGLRHNGAYDLDSLLDAVARAAGAPA